MKNQENLSYGELTKALTSKNTSCPPAQAHGLMCGYICASPNKNDYDWNKLLLDGDGNQKSQQILQQLFDDTYRQLNDFSFEFNLLLPPDNADINDRTEALGMWCQGFIIGLQALHLGPHSTISDEIKNAVENIAEIANVDYGNLHEADDEDAAYFELTEYVRLAILMIYQELSTSHREENNLLH